MQSGTNSTEQNAQPPSAAPAQTLVKAPDPKQVVKDVLNGVVAQVTGKTDAKAKADVKSITEPSTAEKEKIAEVLALAKAPEVKQALQLKFDEKKLEGITTTLDKIETSWIAEKDFIKSVKAAVDKYQPKDEADDYRQLVISGAIHFVLLDLQIQNDGWTGGWISSALDLVKTNRQRLFKNLAAEFGFTKESGFKTFLMLPLKLEEYRLVCLEALRELPSRVPGFTLSDKILQKIEEFKRRSYNNQPQAIDELQSRQPSQEYLTKRFLEFPGEYKAMVAKDTGISTWFSNNQKHQLLITWLFDLLNDPKLMQMPQMYSADSKYNDQSLFYTQRAAFIFAHRQASTAAYRTSRMATSAGDSLNLHEKRSIPLSIQKMHLSGLLATIDQFYCSHDIKQYIAKKTGKKLEEVTTDLEILSSELAKLRATIGSDEGYNIFNNTFGSYLLRFSAGCLAGEALTAFCPTIATAKLLSQGIAVLGYVYWGPKGLHYGKYLGDFLTDQVFGNAKFLFQTLLDTAGATASFAAGTAIGFAIRQTNKGLELIGFKLSPEQVKENEALDQKWIDIVYAMSDAKVQERILRVAKVTDPFQHLKPKELAQLDEKVIEANRKTSATIEAEHARRQKPTAVVPYTGIARRLCGGPG